MIFYLGEIKHFQFGAWPISCMCLREVARIETAGVYFTAVIFTETFAHANIL